MHKMTKRTFTPEQTGMTRQQIIEHVAALAPHQAEYVREHMAQNPCDWPEITTEWTNEFIYGYDEVDRPLVNVGTRLGWETVHPRL